VVDVSSPGHSKVLGFIPAGWYPTGAIFSADGKRIFVMSGKGLGSAPNPQGPTPGNRRPDRQYAGSMFKGALSVLPVPDAAALDAFTKRVYTLTPYSDDVRLRPAAARAGNPVPATVGGQSPIRHVFYIIRENRTYDQVLGDEPRGNGDPNLCLFGKEVTPNAHALVRQFVLLDNFYVDAEVSYSGHAFSTAAYSNDMIEKIWPAQYAGRGGRPTAMAAVPGATLTAASPRRPTATSGISAGGRGERTELREFVGLERREAGDKKAEAVARVPGLEGPSIRTTRRST